MLRKLMKHEFRATARIMGPLFLIVLVLALGANLSVRVLMESRSFVPNLLGGLLMFAFVAGMIGLAIMSIVLMVNRFRTNLMADEGYVMFTLPVTSHEIVWSKIIVSSVWFIATGVVELIAGLICAFDVRWLKELFSSRFFHELSRAFQQLTEEYGLNIPVMILEIVVVGLLGCAVTCLGFYAALATGHSFANHKMALSVLFFFGFGFVVQFVGGIFMNIMDRTGMFRWTWNMDGMAAFHFMMLFSIAITLIVGAIYYVITAVMLKKRLNLE